MPYFESTSDERGSLHVFLTCSPSTRIVIYVNWCILTSFCLTFKLAISVVILSTGTFYKIARRVAITARKFYSWLSCP